MKKWGVRVCKHLLWFSLLWQKKLFQLIATLLFAIAAKCVLSMQSKQFYCCPFQIVSKPAKKPPASQHRNPIPKQLFASSSIDQSLATTFLKYVSPGWGVKGVGGGGISQSKQITLPTSLQVDHFRGDAEPSLREPWRNVSSPPGDVIIA